VRTDPSVLHPGAGIAWGALWSELCSWSKGGVQPKAWGVSKPEASAQKLLESFEEGGKSLSMEELGGDFAPAGIFSVKTVVAWRIRTRQQ